MSDAYLMPREGLNVRYVELEAIILDRETDKVHHLNPSASYIWSRFDGYTAIDDIIQSLIEDFNVDPAEASKEVTDLVEQFSQLNLLVACSDADEPQD